MGVCGPGRIAGGKAQLVWFGLVCCLSVRYQKLIWIGFGFEAVRRQEDTVAATKGCRSDKMRAR